MKGVRIWNEKRILDLIKLLCILAILALPIHNFIEYAFAQNLTYPPDFLLKEVKSGELIHLYSYSNKIVLLSFFTTWCPWDSKFFDDVLAPLYRSYYKDDPYVIFLSIYLDPHKGPEIFTYADEHGIDWPILHGGIWSNSKVAKDYKVNAVPTTFIMTFVDDVKEIIHYKRGYNPESLNKFYEVIETAKKEIFQKGEGVKKPKNLISYQYIMRLPNGNNISLNYSTTSEIIRKLSQDVQNNKFFLEVNEKSEIGCFEIFIPKEFVKSYNSSIERLIVVINGTEANPTYIIEEEKFYKVRVNYGYGAYQIEVFYLTYSLKVEIRSIFGLPVQEALIVLEWPNGKIFKTLKTSSSGSAIFEKVPCIKNAYTLYVKHYMLSFQYIPKEILIHYNAETSFTSFLHLDTLLILILFIATSIASLKIKKHQQTLSKAKETNLDLKK